jgi:hypothetical protein
MNHPTGETGLRKQLTQLRGQYDELVKELSQKLTEMTNSLNLANEVINVITTIVGEEEVRSALEATRLQRRREMEENRIKTFETLLEKGVLVPQETATVDSVVVTSEAYPDGKVLREEYHLKTIPDEQAVGRLLDKKVGDELEVANVKLTITAIYSLNAEKAKQLVEEAQAKAPEAQA